MARKNRQKKTTVYIAPEGNRERYFLEYLAEVYNPKANNINITTSTNRGGTPESIINDALRNQNNYMKVYAWLDEDTPLKDDENDEENYFIFKRLKTAWRLTKDIDINTLIRDLQALNTHCRNPILIISNPLSVEGMLIRILDKQMPQFVQPYLNEENLEENKRKIKSAGNGILGTKGDEDMQLAYYRQHLSRELLEEKSQEIPELSLLLSIFRDN